MLPKSAILQGSITYKEKPDRTFRLDAGRERIAGHTDKLEAIKQAVYLILNTERYQHIIYSWDYGVELAGLMGMPASSIQPEIKRRITEALKQDRRIKDVSGFEFETQKGRVHVTFQVSTEYGAFSAGREVDI